MSSYDQHDPWLEPPEPSHAESASAPTPVAERQPPAAPRPLRTAIAWGVIILSTIVIMAMQYKVSQLPPPPPSDTSPGLDMVLIGRLAIGFERVFNENDPQMLATLDQQAALSPFTTTDQMRLAVVVAELQGPEAAFARLDPLSDKQLNTSLEPPGDFIADQQLLKRIYSNEAYVPSTREAQDLAQRHGWFGELAAGYNLPTQNALHFRPRSEASNTVYLIIGFALILILVAFAGFGLMVTAIILIAMGKIRARFEPGPLAHNSAYLEMVAIFLAAFIGIQLLALLLAPIVGVDLMLPTLLLMAVPLLWPLFCGVSTGQYRRDMGLIAPHGIFKEIFSGIFGYLAGLPIIFCGIIATIIIAMITGMDSEHPAGREILTGGTYEIILLVLATIVWAPLVEEMVFRAAFYRHMRKIPGWATWLAATIVTSFIFAAIHPQGVVSVPLLMSIAIVLAGLRQWRGSLAAPITAHAMHNGTIITMAITLLYL
jgi:membrane protease YdiL (CAAX protease family)